MLTACWAPWSTAYADLCAKPYKPERGALITVPTTQRRIQRCAWGKKCVDGPELLRRQGFTQTQERLTPEAAVLTIQPACLHQEAAEGPASEHGSPNGLQTPAPQPCPPRLSGELGRSPSSLQAKRRVKLGERGANKKMALTKPDSPAADGEAGGRPLCLLAVQTRICFAEEFYDVQRLCLGLTSEKSKCQATGYE